MTNQQPLLDRIRDLEAKVEKLETQLAQAVWNYGEAKREVLMEREACAKVCDDKAKETFSGQCQVWGDYFARAIRARGNT